MRLVHFTPPSFSPPLVLCLCVCFTHFAASFGCAHVGAHVGAPFGVTRPCNPAKAKVLGWHLRRAPLLAGCLSLSVGASSHPRSPPNPSGNRATTSSCICVTRRPPLAAAGDGGRLNPSAAWWGLGGAHPFVIAVKNSGAHQCPAARH